MREILFRGKRIDNGEWVEGDICYHDNVVSYIGQHPADGSMVIYDLDPLTVGQFTGLTDKNGKMIFEGDKVAVLNPKPFARTTGTVVFVDGCFEVKFHREDYGRDYLKCLTCNRECEVIGNIYDNPELLKEEV